MAVPQRGECALLRAGAARVPQYQAAPDSGAWLRGGVGQVPGGCALGLPSRSGDWSARSRLYFMRVGRQTSGVSLVVLLHALE